MLAHLADGDVALAGVVFPVEFAVLDKERAVAEEAVVEELRPALSAVGAADQRALDFLVAVDGLDAEVVPLTAVEVENHRAEADHLGDRPRDQRKYGREVALCPHELGYAHERADARELACIATPRARKQTRKARTPSSLSRSDALLAADRTASSEPAYRRTHSILVRIRDRIALLGDLFAFDPCVRRAAIRSSLRP